MDRFQYRREVDRAASDEASVELPQEVEALLRNEQAYQSGAAGRPQAFSFITVDPLGFPHVLLLSQSQLALSRRRGTLLVSILGKQTRSNLKKNGRAALVVVDSNAAHYLKCTVVGEVEKEGRGGFEFRIHEYDRDSAGVELSPMTFEFSDELAVAEDWDLDRAVVAALEER